MELIDAVEVSEYIFRVWCDDTMMKVEVGDLAVTSPATTIVIETPQFRAIVNLKIKDSIPVFGIRNKGKEVTEKAVREYVVKIKFSPIIML